MQAEKPQEEHEWLQQLVGEWHFEAPGQEPGTTHSCNETVRSLGGLWIQAEGRCQMPDGQPTVMVLTLGYDPQKGKYVGTWVGSMMAYLWVYEGSLDASGRVLTLEAVGPSFTEKGKMATYREVIELKSADQRVFRSSVLGEDGEWQTLMTADYRRVN